MQTRTPRGSKAVLVPLAIVLISQLGHLVEHVAQMVQMHLLGRPAPHAHGLGGAVFDQEWLHLAFNTAILVGSVICLMRAKVNPWLWALVVIAGWHGGEHVYIVATYLATGAPGNPGLLARNGLIAGGLPLVRPDLHFIYNLIEVGFIGLGFTREWRRRNLSAEIGLTRLARSELQRI